MSRDEWRPRPTSPSVRDAQSAEWPAAPAAPARAPEPPPGDDDVGTGAIWQALRSHYRSVLMAGLVLPLCTAGALSLVRMNFTSTGRLYLGELDSKDKAAHAAAPGFDFIGAGASDVASEIEIIKSQSIIHDAIARTTLNASLVPQGWSAPRFGEWLLKKREPSLMLGDGDRVHVDAAALRDGLLKPREYTITFQSETTFDVTTDDGSLGSGKLGERFNSPDVSFVLSAGTDAGRTGRAFTLKVASLEETYEGVLKNLTVAATKLSAASGELAKVVTLEYADTTPERGAAFLRNLMATYLEKRQAWKTADASAAENFVSSQLGEVRQTLDSTQQRLADYRTNTKLMVMDNEAKAMIEQMGKYEEQRVGARLQVASLAEIKRVLKEPNPPAEAFLLGESNDTVLDGLAKTLSESRKELVGLQSRFSDEAPEVKNQLAQIHSQLATIRNYVSSRLNRAQENLSALNRVMGGFEDKLRSVPGAEVHLSQLARESDVYSRLYSYLLERQQQAALLKASTVSKNRILDTPKASARESSPKLVLVPLSAVLGLLLGAVFVVFRHFSSRLVQSAAGLRALTGETRRMGSIPHSETSKRARGGRASAAKDLLVSYPQTAFVDAFRTLREDLYQAGLGHGGHVVLVTSACPGDGKTTTVLSLAALLAADKRQVLVVDANVRDPSHHEVAGYPQGTGLGDVLAGQAAWRNVIRPVSGPFGEFYSIQAGSRVPVDLVSGELMARFLIEARNRFDFVLLDSASFPIAPDALALARFSDGVLSVARIGHTPRDLLSEHMGRIHVAAARHWYLLNDAPETHAELRARAIRVNMTA
jgi:tyrosine-protein kinase Etk/Wzc